MFQTHSQANLTSLPITQVMKSLVVSGSKVRCMLASSPGSLLPPFLRREPGDNGRYVHTCMDSCIKSTAVAAREPAWSSHYLRNQMSLLIVL